MKKFFKFVKEFIPRSKEFLTEVRAEWRKVTRPPRREVVTTTVVVVVTSFVFAIYLWVTDFVIRGVYEWTFDRLGLG